MDLREFVAQTLNQILEGVKDSQATAKELGGEVNPHLSAPHNEMAKQGFLWTSEGAAQVVQFDVALTVTEGTGTKGGIGVFAGAVTLGSSGQSKSESSSVSHVKFGVPVILPKAR